MFHLSAQILNVRKSLQVLYFIWVIVGLAYFFSEFYSNKHFCALLCLRTLAPLFVGSVFAWSISKGYKHGFPLDDHLTFLSLSVVCLLCILFSCILPKELNSRKAVPVRVWSCENSRKRSSSWILWSWSDNNSEGRVTSGRKPWKNLVADVYKKNSYPCKARK